MSIRNIFYQLLITLLFILLAFQTNAASPSIYESPELTIGFTPRTPQQIAAFYEARGFNKLMLEKLKQQCFITFWIQNNSTQVIWLDLSQWQFRNSDGVIESLDRLYWKAVWNEMQIPLAHQSTFRWTLLPETLDFQPEEREGGNIILPRDNKPIQLQATFPTRADKSGTPIIINFTNITCAKDP